MSASLVRIIGVGMTPFGRHPERSLADLGVAAVREALADADVPISAIGAAYFANALGAMLFGDMTIGQPLLARVGLTRVPVVNVENACTSGSTALWLAFAAVAAGQVETALVLGAEKMVTPGFGLINSGRSEIDTQLGLVAPASFAMRARRHCHEFGTTTRQMAMVSEKSRRHAAGNPLAQFRRPETVDEILAGPMIADPLTRSQCSPIADGAAARLDHVALRSGTYENPVDLARWRTDYDTSALAYEAAGLGPEDLDVVECHDAFSIAEILHCEALGLCAAGEGGTLVEQGCTTLGGRIPVNVSGGLLSRGHPIAATGLGQLFELVAQLRGEAGARQVEGAQTALAHCMGGDLGGDAKTCTIAILSR